jgi:hypothetical protein
VQEASWAVTAEFFKFFPKIFYMGGTTSAQGFIELLPKPQHTIIQCFLVDNDAYLQTPITAEEFMKRTGLLHANALSKFILLCYDNLAAKADENGGISLTLYLANDTIAITALSKDPNRTHAIFDRSYNSREVSNRTEWLNLLKKEQPWVNNSYKKFPGLEDSINGLVLKQNVTGAAAWILEQNDTGRFKPFFEIILTLFSNEYGSLLLYKPEEDPEGFDDIPPSLFYLVLSAFIDLYEAKIKKGEMKKYGLIDMFVELCRHKDMCIWGIKKYFLE